MPGRNLEKHLCQRMLSCERRRHVAFAFLLRMFLGVACFVGPEIFGANAESIYLGYYTATGTNPPGDFFLNEAIVDTATSKTYYAGLVWDTGYAGLQQRGGTSFFRHVHFAVWDQLGGATEFVWQNDRTVVTRFGGEGTGWRAMYPFDWNTNVTYRLAVALKKHGAKTEYRGYFFDPEAAMWHHIATFRAIGEYDFVYLASFLEDFGNTSTEARSVRYGNTWLRSNSGTWHDLVKMNYYGIGSTTNKNAILVDHHVQLRTGGNTVSNTPSPFTFVRNVDFFQPDDPHFSINMEGSQPVLRWRSLPTLDYELKIATTPERLSNSLPNPVLWAFWRSTNSGNHFFRLGWKPASVDATNALNSVSNGSFEVPGFSTPPHFKYLANADSNSIAGWIVRDDGIGEPPYLQNRSGYSVLDLDYSLVLSQGSSIETTISTVRGVTYEVSFFAVNWGNLIPASLRLNVGGFTTTFSPEGDFRAFRFTAGAADVLLQIRNESPVGDYRSYQIDHVSVKPVMP